MILQALNSYYERLEQDPTICIAPYGFSRQQIAFCIALNPNGSLHAIDDIREHDGKNACPTRLLCSGMLSHPARASILDFSGTIPPTYLATRRMMKSLSGPVNHL